MNLDVESKHFKIITNILKELVPSAKVFVFGSRAKKNKAKPYSDLDIALDCNGKNIDLSTLARLGSAFEQTTIPYTIDIVDLNGISEEFKNNIKHDLLELNF